MPVCIIIEPEEGYHTNESLSFLSPGTLREKYERTVFRIGEAIEAQGGRSQPMVGEPLTHHSSESQASEAGFSGLARDIHDMEQLILKADVHLTPSSKRHLYNTLKNGQIPVIAPVAGGINPSLLPISADCVLYRICEGLSNVEHAPRDILPVVEKSQLRHPRLSIDRIIVIDPVGGLPARERLGGSHIYINLQQEYDTIADALTTQTASSSEPPSSIKFHLQNLVLVNMCLALLSPTSSALITTPAVAAATPTQSTPQSLIHNLLTDKPLISPSLPARALRTPVLNTTLLRRGLPISVYHAIDPEVTDKIPLDFSRLVQLIEDSFGRRLDVDQYKNRVRDKIAAIIVAGDYEGAAVVTNEAMGPESHSTVPYLDKLAVSSKAQGSGGVADIVFNALISSFPDELIWRSRNLNPVNKWVYHFFPT
jgi:amino-acid N-acetyltransferase